MKIVVPGFSGVNRLIAPQRLQDHEAQVAINCDFRSLDLRSFYEDLVTTYGTDATGLTAASIFMFDTSHFIVETKDRSYARSPTFYADTTTDPRVFTADETPGTVATDWVKQVVSGDLTTIVGKSISYSIGASAKRLGVPKPATPETPKFASQTGDVYQFKRSTRANYDFLMVSAADHDGMTTGLKLLIDAPGFVRTPVTITSKNNEPDTKKTVNISGSRLTWRNVVMKTSNNSTTVKFELNGHGFLGGEQIVLSHRTTSSTHTNLPNHWPTDGPPFSSQKLCRVIASTVTANTFQVEYVNTPTPPAEPAIVPLELTSTVATGNDFPKKVALVSVDSYGFADLSDPLVNIQPVNGVYQADVSWDEARNGNAPVGVWTNAATAEVIRDRAYCVTFVNTYGDESEPSNPTGVITVAPDAPVTFAEGNLPTTAFDSAHALTNYPTVSRLRLYRTDELGNYRMLPTEDTDRYPTNPLLLATVAGAGFSFVDEIPDAELGLPLGTTGWAVPPQGLHNLVNSQGGVIAGCIGRTILGSVPFAPYAFPLANRVATEYDVVGLVPTSAGIVLVTTGTPYLLVGEDPATWGMQKLEYPYGCVSRRSVVDMGELAIYASADGLVAVSGANVQILTKGLMTRAQWQDYAPSTIIAGHVEGRYVASYILPGGSSRRGFMYDPVTSAFTDLGTDADPFEYVAFYNHVAYDALYMLRPDGVAVNFNRDTTTLKSYYWKSKWFQLTIPELMGVAQILTTTAIVSDRSLTFTLWGFDNNSITQLYTGSTADVISGNRPFRLPYVAPGRFTAFQVELSGDLPVGTVVVARTMDELKEA